jgi:hypothetical protein
MDLPIRMLSIKKWIKFWWVFPGVYLAALLIQFLGIVGGAGHSPRSLQFLFYVVAWPSYLLNLLLPRAGTRNPLVNLIFFLVVGLLAYALLGLLLDIAIAKYRHRRN